MNPITEVNQSLRDLPPPARKVVVAVYNYADQTGQFKPSETTQTLSKAVTQGSTSILIKALQDVGQGSWFTVVEREKIDNLLKERKIITQMRMTYMGETRIDPKALPPLLFAGIIFEGGIIGFDSNIQTGGVGARLLGIGGDVKYRLDTITIYLRAVSTKTGQVVGSVTTHKTIASIGLQGGVFKYIAIDKILEAEAGFTKNEPEQLAVQQAIEKAVYAMLIEGADTDVWSFADAATQARLIADYKSQQYDASRWASAAGTPAGNTRTASAQAPEPAKTAAKVGRSDCSCCRCEIGGRRIGFGSTIGSGGIRAGQHRRRLALDAIAIASAQAACIRVRRERSGGRLGHDAGRMDHRASHGQGTFSACGNQSIGNALVSRLMAKKERQTHFGSGLNGAASQNRRAKMPSPLGRYVGTSLYINGDCYEEILILRCRFGFCVARRFPSSCRQQHQHIEH